MKYGLYPGCSLLKNAAAYHESTLAATQKLGVEFAEVPDWNCCGATEYIAIDLLPAYALITRNLALAAQQPQNGNGDLGRQLVAPCSACFLNLSKADTYLCAAPRLAEKVNEALAAGGLHYEPGSVRVRHLLDVVVTDVGLKAVAEQVTHPLYNLRVAPYYGCLTVRPAFHGKYDDPEYPMSLDVLMQTLGATVVDYPVKSHCCGGHMTQISEPVALELIRRLLKNAADYEADVIVTLCPMCQLNLDGYQEAVNRHFGTDYQIPILYFTQLMGLAFGVAANKLGFGKEFVSAGPALAKIGSEPPSKPKQAKRSKEALPLPVRPGGGSNDED
ncbi:MAG: CoB--CoM heterodisulfide reductase iron-sulfur subunit B family protein [Caldilineaceae bacterium]|nr:CoB--CoM heterodisulfide reductase iron-sulfur subunit B family protein [Caldilineaceae bacterium]MBP8109985.1 CoB--CoM heterodisulfide reductase iron-sulfur subunit B family protein [Caldilineaceae bacterium]MBP8125152.1 CoB--CoM heterodisulfide reductase iron-sulfur subunit B family protein [Caldilineaceae bacterium]MBP9072100.1 CoB--CoM heterodisulfide reductase iron-sulfur subunit B family protein [Caldilineaceae bacterium]